MLLLGRLWGNTSGAVAPMVALSLVGLIAAGGIAFDYAHMAAMHTELQNAADQAALAAATQLDGGTDAQTRATSAANSLLTNSTMFASDAGAVTIAQVNFFKSYDDSTETFGAAATGGADAKVVEVVVGGRTADYALTPIVGLMSSGSINARAAASMSSAVCNVPPLMMCAPTADFPTDTDLGKGLVLKPGGGGAWVAGNYGYLDFGNGSSGLKINLGSNNENIGCVDNSNGIPTEPGNKASVTKFMNTRFDLYAASVTSCDASSGNYCPSQNTSKDLAYTETVDVKVKKTDPIPANPGCGATGATRAKGDNNTDQSGFTLGTNPRNLPRDDCHISGSCGNIGDGKWSITNYLNDVHPGATATAIAAAMSTTVAKLKRWDVYQWELLDKVNRLAAYKKDITASPVPFKDQGANRTYTFTNRCGFPQPVNGTGVAPGAKQKDRRLLTVAVVDCTGQNGKFNARVLRFADLFLVEPSLDRSTPSSPYATAKDEVYAEIVRVAQQPNGQSAFQYYLRQRPRLIR